MLKILKIGFEVSIGKCRQQLSFLYVKDLAELVISALDSPIVNRSYNISDGEVYDKLAFPRAAREIFKRNTIRVNLNLSLLTSMVSGMETIFRKVHKIPLLNIDRIKDLSAGNWGCEITNAQRDLRYAPSYKLKEGLRETIQWYEQNNWL